MQSSKSSPRGSRHFPIGIGVIGCGGRVRHLLGQIPGMRKRFRVVAACDPSSGSLDQVRAELNPDVRVYADHRQLVRDPRVAWVFIGSWNCFHSTHAVAALEAGKHVFCEKPLATSLAECLAIKRAHEKGRRRFCIGFTLRYSPHFRKLKQLVSSGAIGDLVSMEFNETLDFNHGGYIHGDWRRLRKNAGTHMLEKCCHDMDIANWVVNSLPVRAASFGGADFFIPRNRGMVREVGQAPNGQRGFSSWGGPHNLNPFTADKDILDNQVVILEYANRVRATFHANCSTVIPERRMYLCGTRGTLRADVIKGGIELCRLGYGEKPRTIDVGARGGHGDGDRVLARELAALMARGTPPYTTLEDGLRAAITCFGIDAAQDTGRVVSLRPLWKKAGIRVPAA